MKLLNTAKKITTAAALAAALLAGTAPKAAAQCPYTVGPLSRYIAPAIVQGMTATDDGAVEVWCADLPGRRAGCDLRSSGRRCCPVCAGSMPGTGGGCAVPAADVPAPRVQPEPFQII